MRISVFGLGYVGSVTAGCLAAGGHTITGVDANIAKVHAINSGKSPIIEKDVGGLIADAVSAGRLGATKDVGKAIAASELTMICVGTPSQANGSLDLQYLVRVCREIGAALAGNSDYHGVVVRSTVLPGTMSGVVIPTLEQSSGKRAATDFGVCNNPEFLRESSAVRDFYNPPKTVIGATDQRSGEAVAGLYKEIDAPMYRVSLEVAEMLKFADNAWHGLKVTFGNEIGNICKALSIDSHEVMDIFCQDTKLNLSPHYLKPGFAFGGSCLPKDLRALMYKARALDLELPVLNSILPSNRLQVERGIQMIMDKGHRKIGFLGFSFKAGTDDLRESPIVEAIERLIGKGYDLRLYDANVNLARLTGANRDYILNMIPHISRLMVESIDEVLRHADVVVIGNNDPAFRAVPKCLRSGQTLIDLVRIQDRVCAEGQYDGICW